MEDSIATLLAVILVATCLLAGLWATWSEHVDRRRERADARMVEHSHVRIVQAPYDWEEQE